MGLHLDKKRRQVQSLVSRIRALALGVGLPWRVLLLLFRGDPSRGESVISVSLPLLYGDSGFSGKLLFKNNWNLEASQTFLDRYLLEILLY